MPSRDYGERDGSTGDNTMNVVIPFGTDFDMSSDERGKQESASINALLEILARTGYAGYVEDDNGEMIRGTM